MLLGRGYFINFDDLSSILDFTLVLTKVPWLCPLVCPAIIHHNLIDNYQMCIKTISHIFVELRGTIHGTGQVLVFDVFGTVCPEYDNTSNEKSA